MLDMRRQLLWSEELWSLLFLIYHKHWRTSSIMSGYQTKSLQKKKKICTSTDLSNYVL